MVSLKFSEVLSSGVSCAPHANRLHITLDQKEDTYLIVELASMRLDIVEIFVDVIALL